MKAIDVRKLMFDVVEFVDPYIVAENLVSEYEYRVGYIDRNGTSSIYIRKMKDNFEIKSLNIDIYLLGIQVEIKHWFEPGYEETVREVDVFMRSLEKKYIPDLIRNEREI